MWHLEKILRQSEIKLFQFKIEPRKIICNSQINCTTTFLFAQEIPTWFYFNHCQHAFHATVGYSKSHHSCFSPNLSEKVPADGACLQTTLCWSGRNTAEECESPGPRAVARQSTPPSAQHESQHTAHGWRQDADIMMHQYDSISLWISTLS